MVLTVPVSEFDLSHLEPDKRRIVMRQLYDFEHDIIFSNKGVNLGLAVDVKHLINTEHNPPVSMRSRRTKKHKNRKFRNDGVTCKQKKTIRISSNPYAPERVMALKKDATLRLYIDYRLFQFKSLSKTNIRYHESMTP